MKKIILATAIFVLSACSPNEADFKSAVPPLEKRMAQENIVKSAPLPPEINLKVPFYSQAPEGDWGEPWQDACEEAATVLAYHFAIDDELSIDQFKTEVLGLVDWETKNFGYYESTDIQKTYDMMLANYQIPSDMVWILEDPTIDSLKSQLAQGHVIIAPFAGRMLGNPFYSGEGPIYHMMVIRGYDPVNFIVNDIGTRRGENFIYPYKTLMNSMHEWNEEDILKGARKVIIVSPFT